MRAAGSALVLRRLALAIHTMVKSSLIMEPEMRKHPQVAPRSPHLLGAGHIKRFHRSSIVHGQGRDESRLADRHIDLTAKRPPLRTKSPRGQWTITPISRPQGTRRLRTAPSRGWVDDDGSPRKARVCAVAHIGGARTGWRGTRFVHGFVHETRRDRLRRGRRRRPEHDVRTCTSTEVNAATGDCARRRRRASAG